jgi:hypothetical protein
VLKGPVLIRDDLGIELYVSYNDCAPYGIRESERISCFPSLHPNTSLEQATAVRQLGEYRYNQDRLRTALGWIAAHPGRAAQLVGERFWFFWFPSDRGWRGYFEQRKRMLFLHITTLASFAGLFLGLRQRQNATMLLALWLAIFPIIYYVVQFEERYRYPILWITLLESACLLDWIAIRSAFIGVNLRPGGFMALRRRKYREDFPPSVVLQIVRTI